MSAPDLSRFVDAQAAVYQRVVEELTSGQKQTHWMWFIFPQLSGLGLSPMARHYAIKDTNQARKYLAHPTLGSRLRQDVLLMMEHTDKSALEILGTPDYLKFRSCLTLFCEAAPDEAARTLFQDALSQFYGGEPDPRTLELLRAA